MEPEFDRLCVGDDGDDDDGEDVSSRREGKRACMICIVRTADIVAD